MWANITSKQSSLRNYSLIVFKYHLCLFYVTINTCRQFDNFFLYFILTCLIAFIKSNEACYILLSFVLDLPSLFLINEYNVACYWVACERVKVYFLCILKSIINNHTEENASHKITFEAILVIFKQT